MEDGLVLITVESFPKRKAGLNPCYDGRWPRTFKIVTIMKITVKGGLNPCYDGRWPRTRRDSTLENLQYSVLILVMMEDGLVHTRLNTIKLAACGVLILVMMEDGLVLDLIRLY